MMPAVTLRQMMLWAIVEADPSDARGVVADAVVLHGAAEIHAGDVAFDDVGIIDRRRPEQAAADHAGGVFGDQLPSINPVRFTPAVLP